MCQAMDEWRNELIEDTTERNLKNLMESLKLTAEQAMDALLVPQEERSKYIAKL